MSCITREDLPGKGSLDGEQDSVSDIRAGPLLTDGATAHECHLALLGYRHGEGDGCCGERDRLEVVYVAVANKQKNRDSGIV